MTASENGIKELVGPKGLEGFKLVEMHEVFMVDLDGRRRSHVAVFKSKDVATAHAATQVDAAWHKTRPVLVLTDGARRSFLLDTIIPVTLVDDEAARQAAREKAIASLTPEQRKALGL